MKKKSIILLLTASLLLTPVVQINNNVNTVYDVDVGIQEPHLLTKVDPIIEEVIILDEKQDTEEINKPIVSLQSQKEPVEICRITDGLTDARGPAGIGADIRQHSFPSSGVIKIAVVYLDFADYRWQRTESTYELTKFLIEPIQEYYDKMSRGRVQLEWVVFEDIISLPSNAEAYNITRGSDHNRLDIRAAVNSILEQKLNTNEWHGILWAINPDVPEDLANVSYTGLIGGRNESFYHMALIAMDARRNGYVNIAHEIGHMFGLPDLYVNVCYNNRVCEDGTVNWLLQFQHAGSWSLMSRADHPNNELMGWERFILNWLDENEVHCIVKEELHTVHLHPLNSNDINTKLIIINLTPDKNLIIEMREQSKYCRNCSQGILVYTIETMINQQDGYIKVIRPHYSNDIVLEDALLLHTSGFNTLEYNNWVIKIVEHFEGGFIVSLNNLIQ